MHAQFCHICGICARESKLIRECLCNPGMLHECLARSAGSSLFSKAFLFMDGDSHPSPVCPGENPTQSGKLSSLLLGC